jgi:hypothetical protein
MRTITAGLVCWSLWACVGQPRGGGGGDGDDDDVEDSDDCCVYCGRYPYPDDWVETEQACGDRCVPFGATCLETTGCACDARCSHPDSYTRTGYRECAWRFGDCSGHDFRTCVSNGFCEASDCREWPDWQWSGG